MKKNLLFFAIFFCCQLHAQLTNQWYISPENTISRMGTPRIDGAKPNDFVTASGWINKDNKGLIEFTHIKRSSLIMKHFTWNNLAVDKIVEAKDGSAFIITHNAVAKINDSGNIVWCKDYKNSKIDFSQPFTTDAVQNKDTIIIGGVIDETPKSALQDITLLKINRKSGQFIQQLQLQIPDSIDYLKAMKLTSDGGLIILGEQSDFHPNLLLIKLDKNSNFVWAKKIVLPLEGLLPYNVIQTKDGGYAVCGIYMNQDGFKNALLLKFDNTGSLLWSKIITQDLTHITHTSLYESSDSSIICCGKINFVQTNTERGLLVKYSKSGELLWAEMSNGYESSAADPRMISTGTNTFATICNAKPQELLKDVDQLATGSSNNGLCNYSPIELSTTDISFSPIDFSLNITDISSDTKTKNDSITEVAWPHFSQVLCNGSSFNKFPKTTQQSNIFTASIAPNVITGNSFTLSINSNKRGNATVIVKQANGAIAFSNQFFTDAGVSNKTFTLNDQGKGFYYVQIIINDQQKQLKFFRN